MTREKTEKLNVHLKGDVAEKFSRIKEFLGLEQDTEAIRALITWYYNQHEKELTEMQNQLDQSIDTILHKISAFQET